MKISQYLHQMIFNKVKILGWAAGLLLVLNITTIATVLYHTANSDKQELLIIEPNAEPLNGRYFRQNLNFDDNQMKVFEEANRLFRRNANQIIAEIEKSKEQMFAELNSPNPDRTKIDKTAAEIGNLHKELKEATATFYLSLRNCCNEQQQTELTKIFTSLFRNPTPICGKGDGSGSRYGRGRGNFE